MTTKEQKEHAAVDYGERFHESYDRMKGFIAGAEWAESQMRWIPGLPKDNNIYLFRLEYFSKVPVERTLIIEIMTGYIDDKGELYYTSEDWTGWDAEGVVICHMPLEYLPAPPAKEGGSND